MNVDVMLIPVPNHAQILLATVFPPDLAFL